MDNIPHHHKRNDYCKTRLKYRQGKRLTAVKVYTIANESRHLLVFGVPKINLNSELRRLFSKYGPILSFRSVTNDICKDTPALVEQFTDVFLTSFVKLEHARRAKKFLDAKSFYGGILHISYGTEYEDLHELRHKLQKRKMECRYRTLRGKQHRVSDANN